MSEIEMATLEIVRSNYAVYFAQFVGVVIVVGLVIFLHALWRR